MRPSDATGLENENKALRAEIARLRARLDHAADDEDAESKTASRQPGARSTMVGHDVLFSAIEKTRMPMIVTDPNQPDDPIIFVNRAFQDLSGYASDELVGRNCRFLQGQETDPEDVRRIRAALNERRDVTVDLLNYRRDGTPFLNELYISPIFDAGGHLLYHFGSQLDVTGYREDRRQVESDTARHRTFLDTLDEGFCVIRFLDGPHGPMSDYLHTEANAACERHLGVADMVGRTLRDIVPDAEADGWLAIYGGVLRTGEPVRFQREFGPTGRHLEVAASRVEPVSRREVAVLFTDVTARWRAETSLRESEERFRTILDTVEAAFAIVEVKFEGERPVDYRFVEANPAFERQAGVDLRGKWVTEFAPDLERHWFETYGHVARTGEPATFESYAEAFKRWFDVRAVRVGRPEDRRIAILFNDVTARKQAEADLYESESRFRALVTAGAQTIYRMSPNWQEMRALDGAGFLADTDAPSVRWLDVYLDSADRPGVLAAIEDAVARKGVFELQHRVRRADGTFGWTLSRAVPILDEGGAIVEWFGTAADVTERVRAEEQRSLLNQEMAHRLKNTLAMVVSIASQTLSRIADQEPVEAFESRLHALSSAHEVLLRQEWEAAPLDAAASAVLGNVAEAERFTVSGPEVLLGPRATLSVSLLLHELATNAVKYGALSNGAGRVALTWRVEGDGGDVVLDWEESGGPPVREPSGRGFGSRLIRMGLVGMGGVALSYPPSGFRAEMRASLAQLRQS